MPCPTKEEVFSEEFLKEFDEKIVDFIYENIKEDYDKKKKRLLGQNVSDILG